MLCVCPAIWFRAIGHHRAKGAAGTHTAIHTQTHTNKIISSIDWSLINALPHHKVPCRCRRRRRRCRVVAAATASHHPGAKVYASCASSPSSSFAVVSLTFSLPVVGRTTASGRLSSFTRIQRDRKRKRWLGSQRESESESIDCCCRRRVLQYRVCLLWLNVDYTLKTTEYTRGACTHRQML